MTTLSTRSTPVNSHLYMRPSPRRPSTCHPPAHAPPPLASQASRAHRPRVYRRRANHRSTRAWRSVTCERRLNSYPTALRRPAVTGCDGVRHTGCDGAWYAAPVRPFVVRRRRVRSNAARCPPGSPAREPHLRASPAEGPSSQGQPSGLVPLACEANVAARARLWRFACPPPQRARHRPRERRTIPPLAARRARCARRAAARLSPSPAPPCRHRL